MVEVSVYDVAMTTSPHWAGGSYGGEHGVDANQAHVRPAAAPSPHDVLFPTSAPASGEADGDPAAAEAQESVAPAEAAPQRPVPVPDAPAEVAGGSDEAAADSASDDEENGGPDEPAVPPKPLAKPKKREHRYDFEGTAADLVKPQVRERAMPATKGWRGAVNQMSLGLLRVPAAKEEIDELNDRRLITSEWSALCTYTAANPKGGAGKTPIAMGVASAFGEIRGGGVLLQDGNESMGTASIRGEAGRFDSNIIDLIETLGEFEQGRAHRPEFSQFVRQQMDGKYDLLASDEEPSRMAQIGDDEIGRLHAVAGHFYPIIGMDTGNNTRSSGFTAIMDRTDQLLIPLHLGHDDTVDAGRLIDQLRATGHGDLVRDAIVVVTGRVDSAPEKVKMRRQWLSEQTRSIIEIPFDPALADDEIRWSRFAPRTQRAFIRLAAEIAAGFNRIDAQRPRRIVRH